MSKVLEFHCQCPECNGITVFPREMRYPGNGTQVHIPFSVDQGSWKCGGCGVVWGFDISLTNLSKEYDETEGDIPKIEWSSNFGRVKAGHGGGLSIG